VFVVVVGAVLFLRHSRSGAEGHAAELLAEARVQYGTGNVPGAMSNLEELTGDYAGTSSGRQGLIVYADVLFYQNRFQEAVEAYRKVIDAYGKDPIFSQAARRGLATALENLERYAEAGEAYLAAADEAPGAVIADDLRLSAGRAFAAAGEAERAVEILSGVAEKSANQPTRQDADLLLAEVRRTGSLEMTVPAPAVETQTAPGDTTAAQTP
jgi:tetratricopeptide (TPR) repeat protein